MNVGIKVIEDGDRNEIILNGTHRRAKACLAAIAVVVASGGLRSQMALFSLLMDTLFIVAFAKILFGSQVLSRQGNELILTKKIGPLKIRQSEVFRTASIANVRVEAKDFPFKGKLNTEYVIVFDYAGRRRVLAESLEKEQANALMAGPLIRLLSPRPSEDKKTRLISTLTVLGRTNGSL